jgi:hypothetical protein
LNHVSSRTKDIRYPKQLLDYRHIGKRRRPVGSLKCLLDGYSRETETGHLLTELRDQNRKRRRRKRKKEGRKEEEELFWELDLFPRSVMCVTILLHSD